MLKWTGLESEMTKEEAVRYKMQWDLVNQVRIEEVRGMTTLEKLRDLEMLFEFGQRLGRPYSQDSQAWQDWARLKELSHV